MEKKRSYWQSYLLLLLLLTAGCTEVKKIITRTTPRETFSEALDRSPIKEKLFVQDWQNAWQKAINDPVGIALPYREKGVFFPSDVQANAFHFTAQRGEILRIWIRAQVDVFAELFQKNNPDKPLTYLNDDENMVTLEIEHSGSYLLVLQPELLATGTYEITLTSEPSVNFPVSGKDSQSVQSLWGADRDGGRRRHEGVDIFAPKGTPVLAVAPGVARASTNRLGGKVVWHRTDKGQNFYYAHLDSQAIKHEHVKAGDTLGFVGNTGNARYTPSHLHFGIYLRGQGAVDPFPYIDNIRPAIPHVLADTTWSSQLARISSKAANFRNVPSVSSRPDTVLNENSVIALKSATGDWYRATLPNGKGGYVHASLVDSLQVLPEQLPQTVFAAFAAPWSEHSLLDSLQLDAGTAVYGRSNQHYLVKHTSGKFLWLREVSASLQ